MKMILSRNKFSTSYVPEKLKKEIVGPTHDLYFYLNKDATRLYQKRCFMSHNKNMMQQYFAFSVEESFLSNGTLFRTTRIPIKRIKRLVKRPFYPFNNSQEKSTIYLKESNISSEEINYLDDLIRRYEQKSFNEIRKASRMLAMSYRTFSDNLFSSLPEEIAIKIAAFTRDPRVHSEESAEKIVFDHFCKPTR
jgi:hypothetical protein